MATAAFRSTTKRSPIAGGAGDDGFSIRGGDAHRRSRSLSRGPARFPPLTPEPSELPTPRSKFVNNARGSGFPDISLDDLADELFRSKYEVDITPPDRGRNRRVSEVGVGKETEENSWRRGRSVSRRGVEGKGLAGNGKKGEGFGEDGAVRRQRSLSVARYRCSDSESNLSAVTDDEVRDVRPSRSRIEKTVRTVNSVGKTEHPTGDGEGSELYKVMRKVGEIRTELQKVMVKSGPVIVNGEDITSNGTDVIQAVAEIRKKFNTEMEQSEKRKQLLLAKLAAEEELGQELTKIVSELLPAPPQTVSIKRSLQSRRRSNDRRRMSERLTEEAEKYLEDFLSNVEDTDISSFDGERSDTSSSLGGSTKLRDSMQHTTGVAHLDLPKPAGAPVETDGIVLPWLQWETCSDNPSSKGEAIAPVATGKLFTQVQEESPASVNSNHFASSRGSCWSPECNGGLSVFSKDMRGGRFGEVRSHMTSNYTSQSSKALSFDMDDYLYLQRSEELLFERSRQRQRLDSGGLILCGRPFI